MKPKKPLLIASDHAGYPLKAFLLERLKEKQIPCEDLGPSNSSRVDYPDFAAKLASRLQGEKDTLGLLICGTGLGMAMTANKFPGIRAAAVTDLYAARMAREHNNANILCLGARLSAPEIAWEILQEFLHREFAEGRHADRIEKIRLLEKNMCK